MLTIKKTTIGNVLANAKGYTLYWYGKDHKNGASACAAQCLAAWPAVKGRPEAAMGVTLAGKLGTLSPPGRDRAGHLQRVSALHVPR